MMRKFTLLASLALALSSMTANAEVVDKAFKTVDLSQTSSFTAHGNCVLTPGTTSMTIKNSSTSGGRGYNAAWDASVYDGITFPETGYTATVTFTVTAAGDNNKNDFEIALIPTGVDMSAKTTGSYAPGTSSIFCLTEVYCPSATAPEGGSVLGTGHYACGVNVAKATTAATPTVAECTAANIDIAVGKKYTLKVNVVGTTAKWSINDADGVSAGSGEYTIPTEETKIGAMYGCLKRASSTIQLDEVSLSYKYDGIVVYNPVCTLGDIVQNTERDYQVSYRDGETLHWILPGETAEAAESGVAYANSYDLLNDLTGTGIHTIECYAAGTLQMWTTATSDPTIKSEVVSKEVKLDWNICPTPVLTITKVSDGYAKTYRVSADNTSMELPKTVYLYYTFTPEGGSAGTRTAINSGDTFEVPGKGSVLVESTTGLQDYGEEKINYSQDTQATIKNSVEYETADIASVYGRDANYNKWTTAYVEGTGLFNARNTANGIGSDTNGGHWANSFASENAKYDYDSYNKRSTSLVSAGDYSAILATSVWCYDAKDQASAQQAFLPIVPLYTDCTADMAGKNGWAWLLDEGVVVDEITTANAKGFTIDPQWQSDDETNKPNLVEIVYTGSYDKYSGQLAYDTDGSVHHIAFATTAAPAASAAAMSISDAGLNLYRYDTSINQVKIHIYKGFTPSPAGIAAVNADQTSTPAVKKMVTKNGIVIVKGDKAYSVAGAQIK